MKLKSIKLLIKKITKNTDINSGVSKYAELLAILPNKPNLDKFSNSTLQPVISLNQMRQHSYSVCFALIVDSNDAEALEHTIQSILHQTDPTWEILLFPCNDEINIVNLWLDIDWRIRCIAHILDEENVILRAAFRTTCDYVSTIMQGGSIECDFVKIVSENAKLKSTPDVIYINKIQNSNDCFFLENFLINNFLSKDFKYTKYIILIRKKILLKYFKYEL